MLPCDRKFLKKCGPKQIGNSAILETVTLFFQTPVILVGTQIDRRGDFNEIARLGRQNLRPITTQQGQQMARKIRAKKVRTKKCK